jgi:hypothetical protein
LEVVAFNSAGIKLNVKVVDGGTEVGILVGEVSVGVLELCASGLAGGEFGGGAME